MTPVLSTMWAQQPQFAADFPAFARVARDAGYAGIEVSHATDQIGLEALLESDILPVRSPHAPTPLVRTPRGVPNSWLNLAAVDEEERREAVEHTLRTIAYAARAGARFVVVHLGGIGPGIMEPEAALRRLLAAGRIAGEEADAARERAWRLRAEGAPAHLAAARRSLAELVEAAASHNIAIGLESRLHFHEIPSAEEAMALLEDYPPDQAGYWHDVGHWEVQGRLRLIDPRRWLSLVAPRMIGTHLHDVRGITDHRAPGNGDVDWSYIAAAVPPHAARTFEIDQHEPVNLLAAAISFLARQGVLARTER